MPLLDHFHPPLFPGRYWESFHVAWSNSLMARLNESVLPAGYFAETQFHIGSRVEVDVATQENASPPGTARNGSAATMLQETWAPPAPPIVLATVFPDEIEVRVYGSPTGTHLVAAIELITPGNKDRPETRQAFAAKCSSYLQVGIGLVIVDVVTEGLSNLHNELMERMGQPNMTHFPPESVLYAVAYRPARRETGDQIDCWPMALALGQPLPVLPLALWNGPTLPLDLEGTYTQACRQSRL
jgi:hypothetical protein